MQQPADKYKLIPHQSYYWVFLQLPGKEYKPERKMGEYLPKLRAFFRHVGKNQIYKKFNSIGFNYNFISEFGPANFELVYIKLKNQFLYTSRQAILKYGVFELYAKNDLDLQIHLPLRYFKSSMEDALQEGKLIEQILKGERSNPVIKGGTPPDPDQVNLFKPAE